jgi:hypothetical protein
MAFVSPSRSVTWRPADVVGVPKLPSSESERQDLQAVGLAPCTDIALRPAGIQRTANQKPCLSQAPRLGTTLKYGPASPHVGCQT